MTNDFHKQLADSHKASHEPFWDAIYRKAFPEMESHAICIEDGLGQRSGIDRIVYLKTGKVIRIDEKKRTKDYGDILLEYESNNNTGSPGWIRKELAIDYLAYAFMKSQRVYLFDWQMLRKAWLNNYSDWFAKGKGNKGGYKIIEAQNKGYITSSVAVPIKDLQRAHAMAFVIDV